MKGVVLDASVVTALLFPEAFSANAFRLVNDSMAAHESMIGQPLLPIEIVNVIRKRMRGMGISLAQANLLFDDYLAYPIDIIDPPGIHQEALSLTHRFSLGGHDAHYVAIARLIGADLWTADVCILRAAGSRLPFVRWIGDYTPTADG